MIAVTHENAALMRGVFAFGGSFSLRGVGRWPGLAGAGKVGIRLHTK